MSRRQQACSVCDCPQYLVHGKCGVTNGADLGSQVARQERLAALQLDTAYRAAGRRNAIVGIPLAWRWRNLAEPAHSADCAQFLNPNAMSSHHNCSQ